MDHELNVIVNTPGGTPLFLLAKVLQITSPVGKPTHLPHNFTYTIELGICVWEVVDNMLQHWVT